MEDLDFVIYKEKYISLAGQILGGCLMLDSEVCGDDFDSEKHYRFTKEQTEKLFSIIAFDDFIELCREKHLIGMEDFLNEHSIYPYIHTI